MKYVIQFIIIVAFSFAGELLHWLLPLPVPASIYGIILMFAALQSRLLKVKHIRETSTFLIAVMPVMFIPPAVGLVDLWGAIHNHVLSYAVVAIVSTFAVMGTAGAVTQFTIRLNRKSK